MTKTQSLYLAGILLIAVGLIWALGWPGVVITVGLTLMLWAAAREHNLRHFGSEEL